MIRPMTLRARIVAVLVAASAALCSSLLAQGAAPAAAPSATPNLAPGEVAPPFDAVGMDGITRHVDFPKGRETVVLFFLSSCPVCHKMLPIWSDYYQRKPKSVEVVGVMLDSPPPGFLNAMPISFPVVRSPGSMPMMRIGGGSMRDDRREWTTRTRRCAVRCYAPILATSASDISKLA